MSKQLDIIKQTLNELHGKGSLKSIEKYHYHQADKDHQGARKAYDAGKQSDEARLFRSAVKHDDQADRSKHIQKRLDKRNKFVTASGYDWKDLPKNARKNPPDLKDFMGESITDKPNLRLIKTHTHGPHSAKVYKDKEWGEYRVKFYKNGQYQSKADSHHDDADDAHGTAQYQIKQYGNLSEDHRSAAAFAINHFGEQGKSGHPQASSDNLHQFGNDYIHRSVTRAVSSNKTSADFKKIGNEILKDKMSFLKEDKTGYWAKNKHLLDESGAGVKSDRVFTSSFGHVNRQMMSSGVQYHSTKYGKGKNKTRYHSSLPAAKKWVGKDLDATFKNAEAMKELGEANSVHTARIKKDWHNKAADDYRKRADADNKRTNITSNFNLYRKKANRHAQAALAADRVIKKKKLDEAALGGEKYKGKSNPNNARAKNIALSGLKFYNNALRMSNLKHAGKADSHEAKREAQLAIANARIYKKHYMNDKKKKD